MKYLGSKRRIAKEINLIMQPHYKDYGTYIEPFVGGANMIKNVTHPNRIGYDINKYVISYFKALKNGWLPPCDVSEEFYKEVKNNKDNYPDELVCFIGICCSFASKWFGGLARDKTGKRNFAMEGFNYATKKDLPFIKDIQFYHKSYQEIEFTEPTIIYCDSPYKGTTKYKDNFNHDEYYSWLYERKKDGHKLFISEYEMPTAFKPIWSKEQVVHLDNNNKNFQIKTERLYTL